MAGDAEAAPKSGVAKNLTTERVAGNIPRRKASGQVGHGEATHAQCDGIMRAAIGRWGLGGMTDSEREDLEWAMAELFIKGTSPEIDWDSVDLALAGRTLNMGVLATVAGTALAAPNPVRVFVRHYNQAQLPVLCSALLNNPDNTILRQEAVLNYGTVMDHAKYCFDTASALPISGMVISNSDSLVIASLRNAVLQRTQADAHSRGERQASSNKAGIIGGVVTSASLPVAPAAERTGFSPLR